MNWNENDLKVMELREQIVLVTEEFNLKYGKDIKDYHKKLDRFIDKKLKEKSCSVFKEQIALSVLPINERFIY